MKLRTTNEQFVLHEFAYTCEHSALTYILGTMIYSINVQPLKILGMATLKQNNFLVKDLEFILDIKLFITL